jgi:uncharacterized phage protein gp47/JayE
MGLDRDAGGVARLLLNIMNKRLSTYYDTLKLNQMMAFVSKAKDGFLDEIGKILDCTRLDSEIGDDDAFRFRITKQIQIVAAANKMAIRLAALSVDGVMDVMLKPFTHGTGSFSVYVITQDPVTPDDILTLVQQKIDECEAYGVRGEVYRPILLPVEMKIRLLFKKTVPDLDRKLTVAQVQDALKTYVNSRNVGQPVFIKEMNELIKSFYSGIVDVIIFNYAINNRPVLPVDQDCAWNERFIESDKPGAIQVI